MENKKELRFFGRRKGKTIKSSKKVLVQELLPQLTPVLPTSGLLDETKMFDIVPKEVWLEIGFGGGEHLAQLAQQYNDVGFLGAEPFINGVASLLAHVEHNHDNVRIWPDDVRDMFPFFKDKIFKKVFLLYPDPWPKARHAERRFTNKFNQAHLHRLLADDGQFYVATDVEDYAVWTQEQVQELGLFQQVNENIFEPPVDWVPTRYEIKGINAGRQPIYLVFMKKK